MIVDKNIKQIPGFPKYWISDKGNLYSCRRGVWKKKKPVKTSVGYLRTTLYEKGKYKNIHIHQLVAIAFLGHSLDGNNMVVDHIDNNPLNNNLNNIQVISIRENCSKDKKNPGVSLRPSGKWCARIVFKGKLHHLGSFKTLEEANAEYTRAVEEIKNTQKLTKSKLNLKKLAYFNSTSGMWRTNIEYLGITKHLGTFRHKEDALREFHRAKNEIQTAGKLTRPHVRS